jgi:cytochrome d ubiquinol oxidase subunit I
LAVGIPRGASLILRHDPDALVRGLDDFPGATPPVKPLFFGFRIMVGIGVLMLATAWIGWWSLRRRAWSPAALPRPLLHVMAAMTFSGWLATLAGWYVTEIGRQPFIVFGLVRTAEVASNVASGKIAATLTLYVVLYVVLIAAYVAVIRHMAGRPPDEAQPAPASGRAVAAVAGAGR